MSKNAHIRNEFDAEPILAELCRSLVHKYPYENAETIEGMVEHWRDNLATLDMNVRERYEARIARYEAEGYDLQ